MLFFFLPWESDECRESVSVGLSFSLMMCLELLALAELGFWWQSQNSQISSRYHLPDAVRSLARLCGAGAAHPSSKTPGCSHHCFSHRASRTFPNLDPAGREWTGSLKTLILLMSVLYIYKKRNNTGLISTGFEGAPSGRGAVIQRARRGEASQRLPAVGRGASLQREQMHFTVARQREYIMLPF